MELNKKYTYALKARALKGILYTALIADPVVSYFVFSISDMDFFIILWIFWVICIVNLYIIKVKKTLTIPIILLLLPVSFILLYNLLTGKIYISYWVYLFPIFSFFFLGIRVSIFLNTLFVLILSATMWQALLSGNISFVSATMCVIAFATIAAVSCMVERFKDIIVDRLEKISATDFLTEIANRREFFHDLEKHINFVNRRNGTFSLIIFDLDQFKKINDRYGHPVGDSILINLARLIKPNLRKEDGFYRIGGEEFAVILPATNIEDSLIIAERFRNMVENNIFSHNISVTISIGLVEYSPGWNSDLIYKAADRALYEAKENGRNRLNVYSTNLS